MCDVRGNRLRDRISNCRDHLKYKWYHFLGPNNEIKYYLENFYNIKPCFLFFLLLSFKLLAYFINNLEKHISGRHLNISGLPERSTIFLKCKSNLQLKLRTEQEEIGIA